jgi:predicted nicotinamide N-methyase
VSLARRFEVAECEAVIGTRTYRLLKPRNVDDLISEEDFAIDERIPYWADVWPSARILAQRLSSHAGAGQRLLELGCGIGLPAIVAAAAGYEALATDYYAEALEFTEANAQRNGVETLDTRLVDWRRLPADLGLFDLIVAADVLYEKPQAALVVEVIEKCLATAGLAIVTDPGRRTADALLEICRDRGLRATLAERVPTTDAGAALHVSVYEIRRG